MPVCRDRLAEIATDDFTKGDPLDVEGRLHCRAFQGAERVYFAAQEIACAHSGAVALSAYRFQLNRVDHVAIRRRAAAGRSP